LNQALDLALEENRAAQAGPDAVWASRMKRLAAHENYTAERPEVESEFSRLAGVSGMDFTESDAILASVRELIGDLAMWESRPSPGDPFEGEEEDPRLVASNASVSSLHALQLRARAVGESLSRAAACIEGGKPE
jgi:hypothetical protein